VPLALWHKVNAGGPCGVQASRPPLVPGVTGSKLCYRPHHAQRSGERDQAGSYHTCLHLNAASRKWVRSACPIPPWFVVSFSMSTTSTRVNWLRSGVFLSPRSPRFAFTGHWPLFFRPTPTRAGASGVRSCADSSPLATAIHRHPNWERPNGTRSRRAAPLCQYVTEIQYVTEPGNFFGQIHPFLPARRRPTVDHSRVAGGAQRQGLQTCRPDGHRPECLFFRRPPCD